MKKCLFALLVALLIFGGRVSALAQILVFTISADGGANYGSAFPKTTTGGLASLVMTPSQGSLNLSTGTIDFRGDNPLVLITPRNINDPVTDTIVEDFDFRIRVAVQGQGVDETTLSAATPAFPYIEFRHTGRYTLEDIKEGTVSRTFNSSPFGGDFGGTGTTSQTLFLAGADVTLSLRGFTLPAPPQFIAESGDYRSFARLNYRLVFAPRVVVSGRIVLEGAINNARVLTFEFSPTDNSPSFQRSLAPNAQGDFTIDDLPRKNYSVRVKGHKWLAKRFAVDATQGNVSNLNVTLLSGDYNNDNDVDIDDLMDLIFSYNKTSPELGYADFGDFNNDGRNDIFDLMLLINNYNKQGAS